MWNVIINIFGQQEKPEEPPRRPKTDETLRQEQETAAMQQGRVEEKLKKAELCQTLGETTRVSGTWRQFVRGSQQGVDSPNTASPDPNIGVDVEVVPQQTGNQV